MWRDRKFFLLHDNVCPYTTAIVQQFLAKKGVAQMSHPLYSPDLVQFCVKVVKSLSGVSKNLKYSEEFGKYSRKFNVT